MPLNLAVTVGINRFEAGGDLVFDDAFYRVFLAWLVAVTDAHDQAAVDAIVAQWRTQTAALAAVTLSQGELDGP